MSTNKEATKEPVKEPVKEITKESVKVAVKEAKEAAKEVIQDLAEVAFQAVRPPPKAPDGYYDYQVDEKANSRDRKYVARVVDQLSPLISKTSKPAYSAKAAAVLNKVVSPQAENDRLGAFEDLLSVMSMSPKDSKIGKALADKAVGVLYNAIPHPPANYLDPKFTFRQADGGSNNLHEPDLGRSGTAYARSVQPKKSIHPSTLPDPGLVFDTLLKASDRVNHHGGNSALTFSFASIVTHSLFKTNKENLWVNDASSYLDLSPLYGNNAREVMSVRDPSTAGRGRLRPDTFADEGMILLPPAASALLVLFNRNHNYIADMLLKLNEQGRWSPSPPQDRVLAQDTEIFETARLINCGHFISIIMNDYVSGFLGLSEGNAWSMNAFDPIKFRDGQTVGRGEGNHVSVEFNLLYRWHTTMSENDELWTNQLFSGLRSFQNLSMDTVDTRSFIGALKTELANTESIKPHERTFAGLTRDAKGNFDTGAIAKILQDATEAPAGQYRARGTPGVMRPMEVLGMIQARRWGVCTMNEFRTFLGLKQFNTFEEWNSDPEIAQAARNLYGHIDNLELYPGLQAEQHMPLSPGLRFSCGYTMTRAVLSDAIALIRGDRFYTSSFSPVHLTSWGFQDATTRPENGGFNGHLPKLIQRHFGRYYPFNNVRGIFPFFTPTKMKDSLERQGIASKYVFDKPQTPPIPRFIDTFEQINIVFNDPAKFVSGYNLKGLGDGYGFMMAIDEKTQHDTDKAMARKATFDSSEHVKEYVNWFKEATIKELEEQSWKSGDKKYVNIVQVIKTVYTYWAAEQLCGIPLKTKENPRARHTVNEVFDMFCDLFTASFLGIGDGERLWSLLEKARKASDTIQGMTRESVLQVFPDYPDPKKDDDKYKLELLKGWAREVGQYIWPSDDKAWHKFISRLGESKRPVNELVANIVGLANGSSVNQAHSAINVIDFYLDESRKDEYNVILGLIQKDDEKSNQLLKGFVREAMRLNPQFTGLWRVCKVPTEVPGLGTVQPGERIWGGFKKAHRNEKTFPNPLNIDPTRDPKSYQLNGGGFHLCIGVEFAVQVITDTLKIVYSLKGLSRAPGETGKLVTTTKVFNQVETNQYVKPDGSLTDWPTSMLLSYKV